MAAGTVTTTEELLENVKKITFEWVSGNGAEGGTASGTTTYTYTGLVLRVVTVPDGTNAPDDNYDITLTDNDSVDIANAQLLNRSTSATQTVLASMGAVVQSTITINIENAGDDNEGICYVYIGITPEQTDQVTGLESALYGTSGIATWPAAAAPADGVSIAEGLRYVVETQIGTLENTGGTATIGGILGDMSGSTVADYLDNMTQQVARTTAAKAISSIASANLFTVSGGPVRVLSLVGYITTGIQAAGNEVKLTHTPTGGAAVDLCAVLDVTGAAIRTFLALDGVKATALVNTADTGVVIASALHMPLVLSVGTIALSAAGTTTGAVSWYVEYEPLAPGATVTAA